MCDEVELLELEVVCERDNVRGVSTAVGTAAAGRGAAWVGRDERSNLSDAGEIVEVLNTAAGSAAHVGRRLRGGEVAEDMEMQAQAAVCRERLHAQSGPTPAARTGAGGDRGEPQQHPVCDGSGSFPLDLAAFRRRYSPMSHHTRAIPRGISDASTSSGHWQIGLIRRAACRSHQPSVHGVGTAAALALRRDLCRHVVRGSLGEWGVSL